MQGLHTGPAQPRSQGGRSFSTTDSAPEGPPPAGFPQALCSPKSEPPALAPGSQELRKGAEGFSLVLDLPKLQCSIAWETEAPGTHKSGTETGIPTPYPSGLPWEVKTALTSGLSFRGEARDKGTWGVFQMGCVWVVLTCTGAHHSLLGCPGGSAWVRVSTYVPGTWPAHWETTSGTQWAGGGGCRM